MIQLSNKRTLMLGLGIVLLSNAIVLAGVAYNRAGEPTSQLTLTERELGLPFSYGLEEESSGISLRMHWSVYDSKKVSTYYSHWKPTEWLDADKLQSLGYDVSYPLNKADSNAHYQKAISKDVFLVFENDGATYQKVVQQHQDKLSEAEELYQQNPDKKEFKIRLEKASDALEAERFNNSRLFAIDAGPEYETLRQQYSDNRLYLIVKGQVKLRYHGRYDKTPYLSGGIQQLSVMKVNIPLEHATVVLPLLEKKYRRNNKQPPRYAVSLKYGQRFEPWVESVKGLEK